jgi:pyridinium-3,5-bisthiocarboxylic acid mononucleotide nickel chelatase
MTLGALAAAGAPLAKVSRRLEALEVPFELRTQEVEAGGVRALRVTVEHPEQHAHRTFADVRRLVEEAGLPGRITRRAIATFRLLAEAEGDVHGVTPKDVTFHEVGAMDSILDIVGSCVALELLEAETISCGPLPMGTGTVPSAHGPLPVPAPATLEVLKGSRVRWTEEPAETTTPTGAALMVSLTGGAFTEAAPPMVLRGIGYGAGRAALEHTPNVLRAVVGELEGVTGSVELLEANVDDAPGELLGAAVEKLLEAGALDAWLEPITMKKGRGAYKVCTLAESPERERLVRLLMRETGALGVRHLHVGRTVAERRLVEVELPYGRCRVKVGSIDGEDFVVSPEHADAVKLARKNSLSLPRVYADARAALREISGSG